MIAACLAMPSWGREKLHFDVDYHYNLGLSERLAGTTLSRSDYGLGGHSLHLSARYDVATRWSAGVGIGLDRYTEPDYNTMPIFATVRFVPLTTIPSAYAFADLGYSTRAWSCVEGMVGNLGVGYTYMISRHFGLNFQVAYNLKRFHESYQTWLSDADGYGETSMNSTRHSLSFGVGLTF